MAVVCVLLVAYTFAGFWVYWLRTGSTTVLSGTLSNVGGLVWFGPLVFGGGALFILGDRGVLRWFYEPRARIAISPAGVRWQTAASEGDEPWDGIGGVSSLGDDRQPFTTVFDPAGRPLVEIVGRLEEIARGDRRRLPERILDVRPDRYVAVDPARPGVGCVLQGRPGADPEAGG